MSDDLFGAPAGWYPDPLGLPQLRWWNNHAWTEQTSAARQPMVVQDTKFAWADDELPTRREERERERSRDDRRPTTPEVPTVDSLRELEPPRAFTQVSQGVPSAPAAPAPAAAAPAAPAPTAAPVAPVVETPVFAQPAPARVDSFYTPDPIVEPMVPSASESFDRIFDAKPAAAAPDQALDALFGAKPTRRTQTATPIFTADQLPATATRSGKLPSSTGPVWAMALIPLFQLVVSLLLLTSLGMGANSLIFIGILVVPYFVSVALAYFDHRTLVASGYQRAAHWGWAFLTAPVYLLIRARNVIRETGHGIGPVLVWFGLGVVHLASFVAIPGLIIALLPAVFSAQIEQSVASDAMLISTTQLTLDCPDTPPLLQGEQIVCPAISGSGNHFDITVTQERANGWIKWQVIDWGVFTS